MSFDYFFWFAQPSTVLAQFDIIIGYFFAILFALGIVLFVAKRFVKHKVYAKLIGKLVAKDLWVGSSGLIWFVMRYESIPIFAKRFWAAALIVILALWLLWILKYFVFSFWNEKKEFDQNLLKSKYLPKGR